MTIKMAVSGLAILLLTACGGGGGDTPASGNQETNNSKTGYDPSLKEQTITAAELQSVKEIIDGNTVTIKGDTTLLAASPDLVVKGNLIIK
ncbi:MAG: hypothetical protein ACRCRW_01245 [Aeromonadaceae bacterium]